MYARSRLCIIEISIYAFRIQAVTIACGVMSTDTSKMKLLGVKCYAITIANKIQLKECSMGGDTGDISYKPQRRWRLVRSLSLLEWRHMELELQLARQRLE